MAFELRLEHNHLYPQVEAAEGEEQARNTKGKSFVIASDITATGEHGVEQNHFCLRRRNELEITQWQVIINWGAALDTQ